MKISGKLKKISKVQRGVDTFLLSVSSKQGGPELGIRIHVGLSLENICVLQVSSIVWLLLSLTLC